MKMVRIGWLYRDSSPDVGHISIYIPYNVHFPAKLITSNYFLTVRNIDEKFQRTTKQNQGQLRSRIHGDVIFRYQRPL